MRKQDLKVGEEYAAGSPSRSDKWRMSKVRVVELNGERPRRNGTMARGIVVALGEDSGQYTYPAWLSGKAGDERVISSAREIIMPWAAYASGKAEHESKQRAYQAEQDRRALVADGAMSRLAVLGVEDGYRINSSSVFMVEPDTMAAILARIPDGHDAP